MSPLYSPPTTKASNRGVKEGLSEYGRRERPIASNHASEMWSQFRGTQAPSKLRELPTSHDTSPTMRFLQSITASLLLVGAGIVSAASNWNIDEAVISVNSKGGAAFKDKYAVALNWARRDVGFRIGMLTAIDVDYQTMSPLRNP